ncbi:hypothetical protein MKX01_003329, partial [Papaver californicum]
LVSTTILKKLILISLFFASPSVYLVWMNLTYLDGLDTHLRSEASGLCLAAFSITIPYVGKFLKGAGPVERPALPEGNKQIFAMSESLSDRDREDLAWGTFVLLKNTNTVSVVCLRLP